MLTIEQLSKRFNNFYAAKDFSLTVQEGEFVTLLGPSGSGKTTVLRMIAGLEPPTSGVIRIGSKDITQLPPQKRNIGVVFQSYALFPNMSAFENIAFPLRVRKWNRQHVENRVQELLELVGLAHRSHHMPNQLSGGERQRVALARALSFYPPLLLLDEPLSALDAKVRQSLRVSLKEIQKSTKVTTLMVTHDQEEALELSDRVVVMSHGKVEQVGTPMDIYYAPQTTFAENFIGEMIEIHAKVRDIKEIEGEKSLVSLWWNSHLFEWLLSSKDVKPGQDVSLRIRPESFFIVAEREENAVKGLIVAKTFSGSVTRIRVVAGHEEVSVDVLSTEAARLEVGREIGMVIVDPRIQDRPRMNKVYVSF